MDELQNTVNTLEICRLCLKLTAAKVNIFTEDFSRMIEMLTSLKITPDDKLPKISCLKCATDVKMAFLVRRRIIQSHRTFTNNENVLKKKVSSKSKDSSTPDLDGTGETSNKSNDILKLILKDNTTSNGNERKDPVDIDDLNVIENERSTDDDRTKILKANETNLLKKLNPFMKPSNNLSLSDEQYKRIQTLRLKINSKYINDLKALYAKRNSCVDLITKINNEHTSKWTISGDNRKKLSSRNLSKNSTSIRTEPLVVPPVQKQQKKEISKTYCKECKIKFNNLAAYKSHMIVHRSKPCPVCNKQITVSYLKKHISLHEASPTICDQCGNSCKNPASLRMHLLYYHRGGTICDECGKSFRTRTKLMLHKRKDHMKERNHKCEICGQSFFLKRYLEKHIQMKHMKLRPHICEYCGKGYSGKHALRTHLRQHTNEAPFCCNICGERFRQRVSLKGHMKSRHDIEEANTVFCDCCGKGFGSAMALDVHSRLHKQIKCKWCTDTFADLQYLNQHIQNVHVKEMKQNDGDGCDNENF